MVRGARESLTSALCFAIILGMLIALDARVRDRFVGVMHDAATEPWGERVGAFGAIILQAARDQSIEHAPLLIFSLVATVLVLFMLRT
jgi:hypothetical protein